MADFKITKAQQTYLDSLVCQRISADKANKELIKTFVNYRNHKIAEALHKAWNADSTGTVAYYIVKDPDGELLLFFSLKCGEFHKPLTLEKLEKAVEYAKALVYAAEGKQAPEWAVDIIRRMEEKGDLTAERYRELQENLRDCEDARDTYIMETKRDGENIVRTRKNYAAVELVHFCVHSPAKFKWKVKGMGPRRIGKTMFWQFVVPTIWNIRKQVGCEYVYLFAADPERDGTLTRYYRELGFEFREDLYVNKPQYDFLCFFMCQKVSSLRDRRRAFFNHYNDPQDPHKTE